MPTTSSPTWRRRSHGRKRSGALAAWLVLAALLVVAAFYGRSQGEAAEDALYDPDLAINGTVFYGLMILVAVGLALFFPRPRRALGLNRFALRWVFAGLGVILLSLVLGRVLEPYLHAGEEQGFAPDRWEPAHAETFVANSLVTILLGPFAEEIFFRGLGVRVLSAFGVGVAIALSALVFGLVHGLVVALPVLVPFGLGLAWVRVRSGSVWPGVVAHTTYNGLGILFLILAWIFDVPLE
jgi:membrane protease YdiL (CAAX protease family)